MYLSSWSKKHRSGHIASSRGRTLYVVVVVEVGVVRVFFLLVLAREAEISYGEMNFLKHLSR